jgi:predicted alpha/beta-hydrolase family hydrolase
VSDDNERINRPATPSGDAIVLTHGAGSDADAPLLVALAEEFAAAGMLAIRYQLPFRQARRTGPPSPASAEADRAGLREMILTTRPRAHGRLFLGGHSYGGRQASLLAAETPELVDALLLLAYPLHPPRRPREQRTAHFPSLRTPALFVHGSRDPFGSLEELEAALALLPAPVTLLPVEGAPHGLIARPPRGRRAHVVAEIVRGFCAFVDHAALRR